MYNMPFDKPLASLSSCHHGFPEKTRTRWGNSVVIEVIQLLIVGIIIKIYVTVWNALKKWQTSSVLPTQ